MFRRTSARIRTTNRSTCIFLLLIYNIIYHSRQLHPRVSSIFLMINTNFENVPRQFLLHFTTVSTVCPPSPEGRSSSSPGRGVSEEVDCTHGGRTPGRWCNHWLVTSRRPCGCSQWCKVFVRGTQLEVHRRRLD